MKLKDILIKKLLLENRLEGDDFNHSIDGQIHHLFKESGNLPTSYEGELSPENTTNYLYHNFHTLHKNSEDDKERATSARYPHLKDEDKEMLVKKSGHYTLENLVNNNPMDYKLFEKGIDSHSNLGVPLKGSSVTWQSSNTPQFMRCLANTLQSSKAPPEEIDRITDKLVNHQSPDAHLGVLTQNIFETGLKDHHISKLLESEYSGVREQAANRPLSKENYDKAMQTKIPELNDGSRPLDERVIRLAKINNPHHNNINEYFKLLDADVANRNSIIDTLDGKKLLEDDINRGFKEHGKAVHGYILTRAKMANKNNIKVPSGTFVNQEPEDPKQQNYTSLTMSNVSHLLDKNNKVSDELKEHFMKNPSHFTGQDELNAGHYHQAVEHGGNIGFAALHHIPTDMLNEQHFKDLDSAKAITFSRKQPISTYVLRNIRNMFPRNDILDSNIIGRSQDFEGKNPYGEDSLHNLHSEIISDWKNNKDPRIINNLHTSALQNKRLSPDNISKIANSVQEGMSHSFRTLNAFVNNPNTPSDVIDKIHTEVMNQPQINGYNIHRDIFYHPKTSYETKNKIADLASEKFPHLPMGRDMFASIREIDFQNSLKD